MKPVPVRVQFAGVGISVVEPSDIATLTSFSYFSNLLRFLQHRTAAEIRILRFFILYHKMIKP